MKKVIAFFAAISMLALSCQKEITLTTDEKAISPANGKLTATIVKTQTKVNYTETEDWDLQPAWEVGDEIIGFDDAGNTYTLTVASVSGETATLSGTVPDGAMHLIYKCGAQASDISAKTLTVDYSNQAVDSTMPAVMLADGTVTDGSCYFEFTNAGAIIGICAVNGMPSGSEITKITISGENLSAATVALDGSTLALTATEKADDAISIDGFYQTVLDDFGTLSAPVFFAVPAGAVIAKVTILVAKEPETMKKPSPTPQEGVDYVTIGGTKWAKWNVGASSGTDYGWYFPWAGTEGYVRYANTWQLAEASTIEFSYTPSSPRTAEASDYLYVKDQEFIGHSFVWANAPFNNGSSSYNASYFSSVRNTVCPDNTLAPDYDAAQANWGGDWRMPTLDEFIALGSACGCVGQTTLPADLSSANPGKGVYWVSADQSYIAEYTGVAGLLFCDGTNMLFFPAAGSGIATTYNGAGYYNRYWASTLRSSAPNQAYYLYYLKEYVNPQGYYERYGGLPVRPVLTDTGALPGLFSVSDTKKVRFSKGNLRYTVSTGKWGMFDNQYESGPANYSDGHDAEISLFTWGYNATKSIIPDGKDDDNVSILSGNLTQSEDWGSQIGDGSSWRTLTGDEWAYLLSYDASANPPYVEMHDNFDNDNRRGKCKFNVTVCGKEKCTVIAPDNFTGTIADSYDASAWSAAEIEGLVCFPTTGFRVAGNDILSADDAGYYWSSTTLKKDGLGTLRAALAPTGISIFTVAASYRVYGHAVRLVTDAN